VRTELRFDFLRDPLRDRIDDGLRERFLDAIGAGARLRSGFSQRPAFRQRGRGSFFCRPGGRHDCRPVIRQRCRQILSLRPVVVLDQPFGPARGLAAGGAGIQRARMGIHPEGPSRVDGHEPPLEIPEHQLGNTVYHGAKRAGRKTPAGVGEVPILHLPVDHVSAARAKAAQRKVRGRMKPELKDRSFKAASVILRRRAFHACLSDAAAEPVWRETSRGVGFTR